MAITLNNKTRLTTHVEKLFVEAGGGKSEAFLSKQELSTALATTINILAERHSPILIKLYKQCEKAGKVPPLDQL